MSSLDFDIDTQMTRLELEWRQAFEASMLARADFDALNADARTDKAHLQKAVEALNKAEGVKARVMRKIESFEDSLMDG